MNIGLICVKLLIFNGFGQTIGVWQADCIDHTEDRSVDYRKVRGESIQLSEV
ncbi:MAG: hypothetical protein M9962_10695 [Oligoflexia bacterium]|nr:hypothetical protein [Oligoflexia bacterium]